MEEIRKPLLIFDGECGFCRVWVERWKKVTGEQIEYAPYQEIKDKFPNINEEEFQESIKLVEWSKEGSPESTKIYSAAEAAFRVLAYNPKFEFLLWLYQYMPGFKWVSELFYKVVAKNRKLFSKLMQIAEGGLFASIFFLLKKIFGVDYNTAQARIGTTITQNLFFRSLGVTYFIAFTSLLIQAKGLFGKDGILPISEFMLFAKQSLGNQFFKLPTLFWWDSSNNFIIFLLFAGIIFSALLVLNVVPRLAMFTLFFLYLSFVNVGRDFLSFQWDVLLLETGFLSFMLSLFNPGTLFNTLGLFLLRFLLFKLMFMSGAVKLSSGDPSWHNLTAMNYHYETQPIPNPIAFYAHQLPEQFQKLSTLIMFAIELVLPWFIFLGRGARVFAFMGLSVFQLLIIMTGNYCFFNLLTIFLCFLLLDDDFLKKYMPFMLWGGVDKELRLQSIFKSKGILSNSFNAISGLASLTRGLLFIGVFLVVIPANIFYIRRAVNRMHRPSNFVEDIIRSIQPFHVINNYGLFAVMTTVRNEIVVEGSNDGQSWLQYEFKWKPGNLKRMPPQVAPHQPRLDWQMWFAALRDYRREFWFRSFIARLLYGSPEVSKLLDKNPFPDEPPKYIRALFYEYRFTDLDTYNKTGQYWIRSLKSVYMPPVYKTNS